MSFAPVPILLKLFAYVMSFLASLEAHAATTQPPFQVFEKAVVKVEVSTFGIPSNFGAGFFIKGDGTLLTNRHVIEPYFSGNGTKTLRVVLKDGTAIDGAKIQVLGCSTDSNDICVLKLPFKPSFFFRLRANPLEKGHKVYAIGHPLGLEFSLSDGIVSGYQKVDPNASVENATTSAQSKTEVVLVSIPINAGNSGGPVFDETGAVAGMATWIFAPGRSQNLNFAVSSAEIEKFVASLASGKAISLQAYRDKVVQTDLDEDKRIYDAIVKPLLSASTRDQKSGQVNLTKGFKPLIVRSSGERYALPVPENSPCTEKPRDGNDTLEFNVECQVNSGILLFQSRTKMNLDILKLDKKPFLRPEPLSFVSVAMKSANWLSQWNALNSEQKKYLETVPYPSECFRSGWSQGEFGKMNFCRSRVYNFPREGSETLYLHLQRPGEKSAITIAASALNSRRKASVYGVAMIAIRNAFKYPSATEMRSPSSETPAPANGRKN